MGIHSTTTIGSIEVSEQSGTVLPDAKQPDAEHSGKEESDAGIAVDRHMPTEDQRVSRANRLLASKLTFVHSAEFEQKDAEARILQIPLPSAESDLQRSGHAGNLPSGRGRLCEATPLSRELEQDLFRRMNFLKFLSDAGRRRLDPERPSVQCMDRIDQLMSEAAEIRNRIVRANQRLVVSITRQFPSGLPDFDELVSDGNLTMMKAVSQFDYRRGIRFSTYATHAVRRDFYRRYKRNSRRQRREMAICPEDLIRLIQAPAVEDRHAQEALQMQCVKDLIGQHLSDRDRSLLDLRYGLSSGDGGQTLQQVGAELGLSKERVRQLQMRIIHRIRTLLQGELPACDLPEPL